MAPQGETRGRQGEVPSQGWGQGRTCRNTSVEREAAMQDHPTMRSAVRTGDAGIGGKGITGRPEARQQRDTGRNRRREARAPSVFRGNSTCPQHCTDQEC